MMPSMPLTTSSPRIEYQCRGDSIFPENIYSNMDKEALSPKPDVVIAYKHKQLRMQMEERKHSISPFRHLETASDSQLDFTARSATDFRIRIERKYREWQRKKEAILTSLAVSEESDIWDFRSTSRDYRNLLAAKNVSDV